MSQGTFLETRFDWKLLKEYLYFVQKSTFVCMEEVHGFWSKMT